jgi:hypothetical protein
LASCQFGGTREIHRAAVENGAKHMADLLTIASSPNGDGMPTVDEQARMKAQAHMAAMSKVQHNGMPPLPGGLDG